MNIAVSNPTFLDTIMDAVDLSEGQTGSRLPVACLTKPDSIPDWKHYRSLNYIKLSYEPSSPNERAGISPVTVRRVMKVEQDNYYRKLRRQRRSLEDDLQTSDDRIEEI